MNRKSITEESGIHKEWMERAKEMTLDDLPKFLRELTEDYEHDYGTICHAIAAAAVAAAWAVERTPQGGITGFQFGAITWEILRGWNESMLGEVGTRIVNYDNLAFPQYENTFTAISQKTWEGLQKFVERKMKESDGGLMSAGVLDHWQSILDGNVPFGLRIIDD